MNRTLLLALIERCRKVILDELEPGGASDHSGNDPNATTMTTAAPATPVPWPKVASRPYDNAYFYILFVMFFYAFLALTLFRSFARHDKTKKDPYEEFIDTDPTANKFHSSPSTAKFDFEEDSSL